MKNVTNRSIRHFRVRKKVVGSNAKPRLAVFRSNKNTYAQLLDDKASKTLAAVSTLKIPLTKDLESQKSRKLFQAEKAGENLAKVAARKNIKKVVFDRGGYKYHGRIKALAEAAKKGGMKF